MSKRFRPVFVDAINLDDCWFQLLYNLMQHGRRYTITEGSFKGHDRITFDFVSGFIHDPHMRPLSPQIPETCNLPAPTNEEEIEEYFVNYLMDSKLAINEDYKYATWVVGGESCLYFKLPNYIEKRELIQCPIGGNKCIRKHIFPEVNRLSNDIIEVKYNTPNMVEWVIEHFKKKGFGNEHCYITVGDPTVNLAYDVPYSSETERRTSPCLRGLDFRIIRDNNEYFLLTHVIYRSWDLVGGWPTNMGGFTLLNEYISAELGINPGPLSFSCKSLHAYSFHEEYLKTRLHIDA